MVAAAVQGDVDGIAKGSHFGRVARVGSIGNGPLDRSKRGPGWDRGFPPKQSLDGAPKDRACDEGPEQRILRPAYPTAWGPERAGSQDDTAKVIVELRPPITLPVHLRRAGSQDDTAAVIVGLRPLIPVRAEVRRRRGCLDGQSTKNGPRFRRGPSCLGSLVLRELFWRPDGRGAVGAGKSLRGWLCGLCRSAPVGDYMPWGDVESWAAKLFSINRMCTLPALMRAGLVFGSAPAVSIGALPSATKCIR